MEQRLKQLRKKLGLTQEEFAKRLGIKRTAISNYEIGRNTPIDAVIPLICREFNVNETWLRTNEGEMFVSAPETELVALLEKYHLSDIGRALIYAYIQLSETDRASVDHYVSLLAAGCGPTGLMAPEPEAPAGKIVPLGYSSREALEAEADEFAAMAREQFLSEKRRELSASSAKKSGAG